MRLALSRCVVRTYRMEDAPSLAKHANNRRVWLGLRDAFPHPYTVADGERFIKMALEMKPERFFTMEVDGEAAGGIGYMLHTDVERLSAEIGYWLSEAHWGKGIVTEALVAVRDHAIEAHGLTRVFAVPYSSNPASFRVLEKAGFTLEGVMRKSVIKDGKVLDQRLYAYVVA